jgi:hypothetical protein
MRLVAMALAGAMALSASPAGAAANLDTDDFQFADVVTNNALVSFDITTIARDGDTASMALVSWTYAGIGWSDPSKAAATIETNVKFDCVRKTDQVVGITKRDAQGNVTDQNDSVTPPAPVGEQTLAQVSQQLACSPGRRIGNLPIYTGKAAALVYTAQFFARTLRVPPKPAPPKQPAMPPVTVTEPTPPPSNGP